MKKEGNKKMPTPRHKAVLNNLTKMYIYRDGVMNGFCVLVSVGIFFLFHDLTSLHPPSFYRNNFSTCTNYNNNKSTKVFFFKSMVPSC